MSYSLRKRRRTTLPDKRPVEDKTSCSVIDKALSDAGITQTMTKGGWCLKEGLRHICSVSNGHVVLLPLLQHFGPPTFYHTDNNSCRHASKDASSSATNNMKAPTTAFESLCRIVAGQQLAGAAAQAVWSRLLETTNHNLTPVTIISLTEAATDGALVDNLQKPAGLSFAKARSILDLSHHFARGDLTEDWLTSTTTSESDIRQALLQVRGLGPWSCDMFLMFCLEKSNVMPIGDLGVRKGLARAFSLRGTSASTKRGSGAAPLLCPKKDLERIQATVEPFAPYQSLVSFYMWKAADTADFYNSPAAAAATPTKPRKKQGAPSARVVTPEKS